MSTRIKYGLLMIILFIIIFGVLPYNYMLLFIIIGSHFIGKEYINLLQIKKSTNKLSLHILFLATSFPLVLIFFGPDHEKIIFYMHNYFYIFIFAIIGIFISLINLLICKDIYKYTQIQKFINVIAVLLTLLGFNLAIFMLNYFSNSSFELLQSKFHLIFFYPFLLIWSSDSGAYFIGRLIGKHKFSQISPNKTIEGAIGGIICACIITFIYVCFVDIFKDFSIKNVIIFIILSIVVVIVGIFGDLYESLLKRQAGMKDSSKLIPGHGGILDRIDSLLPAVTIFAFGYFYII